MTTPTANPIPSTSPLDLLFNAETLDQIINGASASVPDRFGIGRLTLAGALARLGTITSRGSWVTATLYQFGDLVNNAGTWYISLDTHTSGASFAGDQAAHWRIYQGVNAGDLASQSAGFGAELVGRSFVVAASRTELKTLGTSRGQVAFLTEAGREGDFVWRAGNYSTQVAADTQEGIYVKANAVAATSGAWVRKTVGDGEWHSDWFGVPNDPAAGAGGGTEVQAHTQASALINLGNIVKPSLVRWGSKIFTLGAALPLIAWQVIFEGSRGFQGTIFCKRFVEASATLGVFRFGDYGFHLRDITWRATSGSGGSFVSVVLSGNAPAAGRTFVERCYFSGGDFVNYNFYVNGSTNVTVSGPSYRGIWFMGGEFFGCAVSSIKLVSVHHVFADGIFITSSGGTSTTVLDIGGDATAYSDDIQMTGQIGGAVTMDYLQGRSVFRSPQIANITVGANCTTKITWDGPRHAGVVTNNAPAGVFNHTWDGEVVVSGGTTTTGWRKWGDGRLEVWDQKTTASGVLTGQSWPLAFTSSAVRPRANVSADAGTNIITIPQITNVTTSGYDLKAGNLNYSTAAVGAASVTVTLSAIGSAA